MEILLEGFKMEKYFAGLKIFLLFLISFLMPLHIWIPELSLFCFLFWILQGDLGSKLCSFEWKENKKVLLLLWGYFLYIAVSVFFFDSFESQFSEIEKRWGIFIYPLIFLGTPQLRVNKKWFNLILLLFVLGVVVTASYALYVGHFTFFVPSVFLGNRIRFSNIVVLGLAFSIYLSYEYRSNKKFLLSMIFAQIIFVSSIYVASSRSGIVSVTALGVLVLIFALSNKYLLKKYKLILLIIVLVISYVLIKNERMKKNIVDSARARIYKAAFYSVRDGMNVGEFFIGKGEKEATKLLNYNLNKLGEKCYPHPHDDFLSILLKRGLFGLIFFIGILWIAWYKGVKNKDFLLLSCLLIFSVYHLFNGVFESRHDIYFFYYFYCLLMFCSPFQKKE